MLISGMGLLTTHLSMVLDSNSFRALLALLMSRIGYNQFRLDTWQATKTFHTQWLWTSSSTTLHSATLNLTLDPPPNNCCNPKWYITSTDKQLLAKQTTWRFKTQKISTEPVIPFKTKDSNKLKKWTILNDILTSNSLTTKTSVKGKQHCPPCNQIKK